MELLKAFVQQHQLYLITIAVLIAVIVIGYDALMSNEELQIVPVSNSDDADGCVYFRMPNGNLVPRHFRFLNKRKPRRLNSIEQHTLALRLQAITGMNRLALPSSVDLKVFGQPAPTTYMLS